MDRRTTIVALFAAGAAPLRAFPQTARKMSRIGVLGVTSPVDYARQVAALKQGFRDLGYIEGQNVIIDFRWAESRNDRLPALAAELIGLEPDVLVTSGSGTRVLKQATTTIPIVMAVSADAVASGLVASLAEPGGNITGSTSFGPEIAAKRLELLKAAVPRLGTVAVIVNPGGGTPRSPTMDALQEAASGLRVELVEVQARTPGELDDAVALALRRRADGLLVTDDTLFVARMRRLGELSLEKRIPGIGGSEFAEGGGLLAYGVHFPDLWGRAPSFVDRILKGAKPATMPVERASRFALTINLRTATALGVAIPQALVLRADEVIR